MRRSHRLPACRLPAWLVVPALLLALSGCQPEFGGSVSVDGKPFEPSECRSGQANGFAGVDLIDEGGRTLRIVQSPTNQPQAILILGSQTLDLGTCGSLTLARQNSTVNDITNVEGSATLSCKANDHSVEGTVSFKNCH